MSVFTFVEPTPDQLARIAVLEPRARAVFREVAALSEEITALKEAGLETREAAEAVAGVDNDALDELRTLRVTRGISPFSDWWSDRVLALRTIEDESDEPGTWRRKYLASLAVDQAIAMADPELTRLLDRAADRPLGPIDARKLEAAIGMTQAELQDRAEAVVTTLIESGWRP